jgi:hypothetical protein
MFCVVELVEQAKLKIGISSDALLSKRSNRTSPCSNDYAQRLLAQWANINPELDSFWRLGSTTLCHSFPVSQLFSHDEALAIHPSTNMELSDPALKGRVSTPCRLTEAALTQRGDAIRGAHLPQEPLPDASLLP